MSVSDNSTLLEGLTPGNRAILDDADVYEVTDSTNTRLLEAASPAPGRARIALADYQTAGRGRHDREWVTRPGSCLCLSLAYTFERVPDNLSILTLVMGVAVSRVLVRLGVVDVLLKWPNDIVFRDRKLGGLLAEAQLRSDRKATVIAGVGINLALPDDLKLASGSNWAQAAADLGDCLASPPGRDALAIDVSNELLDVFSGFTDANLDELLAEWRERDWLRGRSITVDTDTHRYSGTAAGITPDGELLIDTGESLQTIVAGTISLDGSS